MHLVYDFDSTLFCTDQLWATWRERLMELGFEEEQVIAKATPLFLTAHFNLQNHAEALGLTQTQIDKLVKSFAKHTKDKAPGLVFPDVVPHLDDIEATSKSILTFGEPEYQSEKIEVSGLGEYFDDILIARENKRKHVYLRELLENGADQIVFVDDNPRELEDAHEAGLPVTLIRMRRENMYHSHIESKGDEDLWPCVQSFEDVSEYL